MFKKSICIFVLLAAVVIGGSILGGCGGDGGGSNGTTPVPEPTIGYQYNGTWSITKNPDNPDLATYAGTYEGSYTGSGNGAYIAVCCSDGRVFVFGGSVTDRGYGIGTLDSNGKLQGTSFGSDGVTGTFSGTISGSAINGTWSYGYGTGTWTAVLKAPNPSIVSFAGSYQGTFTGDDAGECYIGIGNEGTLIGLTQSALNGMGGVKTFVTTDGSLEGIYESFATYGTFRGLLTSSGGTGTWGTNNRN